MKTQISLSLRWGRWFLIALLVGAGCGSSPPSRDVGESREYEALPRGVKRWSPDDNALPSRLAFGRSVAFLVGVSKYEHLPQLPFVLNDLRDMRKYLLEEGGFEKVYVAEGDSVSAELIEDYMMNKFPVELGSSDRLLFYFAGHGADAQGQTGYMLFAGARRGDFAHHVLAVERVQEWSRVNGAAHMLFVFDSCSSGLGINSRSGLLEDDVVLINTLSGSGSRAVLTAGTANERTVEVPGIKGGGNGVFTRAFLDALHQGWTQEPVPPFLTIEQVFAELKLRVARFAARQRVSLTPKLWPLYDEGAFRGSFVFVNPAARLASIREERARPSPSIGPKPSGRGEIVSQVLQGFTERNSDLLLGELARSHPGSHASGILPPDEEILGILDIKGTGNFLVFGVQGIYSYHNRYGKASIPYSEFDRLEITVRKLRVVDFGTYGSFSTVGSDVSTDTLISILKSLQQNFNIGLSTTTGGQP